MATLSDKLKHFDDDDDDNDDKNNNNKKTQLQLIQTQI